MLDFYIVKKAISNCDSSAAKDTKVFNGYEPNRLIAKKVIKEKGVILSVA